MPISGRILRHFIAPLVLIGLAALIIARNSRADSKMHEGGKPSLAPALRVTI